MAKISLQKAIISGAVGLIDIGAKQLDASYGKVLGPLTPSMIAETGLAIGSALVNYMGIETDKSETIFYASLPLFEVGLAKLISERMAGAAIVRSVPPAAAPAPSPSVKAPSPAGKYVVTG